LEKEEESGGRRDDAEETRTSTDSQAPAPLTPPLALARPDGSHCGHFGRIAKYGHHRRPYRYSVSQRLATERAIWAEGVCGRADSASNIPETSATAAAVVAAAAAAAAVFARKEAAAEDGGDWPS